MTLFVPGLLYEIELPCQWGRFDLTEYCKTDARALGNVAQHILREMFDNLYGLPGKETAGDLLEHHANGCRVWEVKTTKGSSVNIQTSGSKGVGRKFCPERHAEYLRSVAGVIAIDQRKLPTVAFCGIFVEDIRAFTGKDLPRHFRTIYLYEHALAT